MSSITGIVSELATIEKELQSLRSQVKKLNKRKADLEQEVIRFMESKEQTGLKYKGMRIEAREQEAHRRLKKGEKEESIKDTLRRQGVHDPDRAYTELIKSMKGSPEHKVKIKISKLK
jgi:methylphosphotriester-DNA--protein-cysteine methyltransferase